MRESKIERKVCKDALELLGIPSLKLYKLNGWPDRVFLIPGGRPLFIEFKAPGENPEPLQEYMHTVLRELGYQIEVHDNYDEAIKSIGNAVEAARVPKKKR